MPEINHLSRLRLMQLADSAIPIGSTAHSFGLETLVATKDLELEQLHNYLKEYFKESGLLEATYCRRAYRLVAVPEAFEKQWLTLNERLSAYKPARESREAGGTLGRRLLQLVRQLEDLPLVESAIESARQAGVECHHCAAFGLVGGLLGTGEEFTAVTFLQQSLTGLVSACQRLLPLGQTRAARLIWDLKAPLLEVIAESQKYVEKAEPEFFSALPELGSMRHPTLSTRLFIS